MDNKSLKEEFLEWESNFYLEFGQTAQPKEVADFWIAKMDLQRKELFEHVKSHLYARGCGEVAKELDYIAKIKKDLNT